MHCILFLSPITTVGPSAESIPDSKCQPGTDNLHSAHHHAESLFVYRAKVHKQKVEDGQIGRGPYTSSCRPFGRSSRSVSLCHSFQLDKAQGLHDLQRDARLGRWWLVKYSSAGVQEVCGSVVSSESVPDPNSDTHAGKR